MKTTLLIIIAYLLPIVAMGQTKKDVKRYAADYYSNINIQTYHYISILPNDTIVAVIPRYVRVGTDTIVFNANTPPDGLKKYIDMLNRAEQDKESFNDAIIDQLLNR